MSRFENSYLAESVGYNNGHARGIAHGIEAGKQAGFTEGWNAAIMELRAALEKSLRVSELYHVERDELGERYEREKAKRERLQYLVNLAREHGVNVEDFDR